MAEPKTVKKTLYNSGAGPRTFHDADRSLRTLRPGESWEGKIFEAEWKDLSPDLKTPPPKAEGEEAAAGGGQGGTSEADAAALASRIANEAEQLVKANDENELRALAEKEEVKVEGDDNKNDLALKIVRKRLGVAEA